MEHLSPPPSPQSAHQQQKYPALNPFNPLDMASSPKYLIQRASAFNTVLASASQKFNGRGEQLSLSALNIFKGKYSYKFQIFPFYTIHFFTQALYYGLSFSSHQLPEFQPHQHQLRHGPQVIRVIEITL